MPQGLIAPSSCIIVHSSDNRKIHDAIGTGLMVVRALAGRGARDGRRQPNFAEIYSLNI